jgi:hypothetical protein
MGQAMRILRKPYTVYAPTSSSLARARDGVQFCVVLRNKGKQLHPEGAATTISDPHIHLD